MTNFRKFVPGLLVASLVCIGLLGAKESVPTESAPPSGSLAESVPCVESPDRLQPLSPGEPIWVSPDRTEVVMVGTVVQREGLLEFFACRTESKEHESILTLNIKPYIIHAALLVIGATQGASASFAPEFVPPSGEEIDVTVRWRDPNGMLREARGQEWVRRVDSDAEMTAPWVFTGSVLGKNQDGRSYYLADVTGEIIGVSNFSGTILDVPLESSSDNAELMFEPFTERIPPVGTPVTLILSRHQPATSDE